MKMVYFPCPACGETTRAWADPEGVWIDCECGNFGYIDDEKGM